MNKSKTTIIFIGSLVLALISLVVFSISFKVIKNKNQNINGTFNILQEKINQQNKSDLIKKNELYIKDSSEQINSYFVDPENINVFIGYIENIGAKQGVELTVKNVEISKTNKKIILIGLDIEGSFSGIFKTVKLIEYAPFKIHVKSFYLNKTLLTEKDKLNKDKTKKYFPWQAGITMSVVSSN